MRKTYNRNISKDQQETLEGRTYKELYTQEKIRAENLQMILGAMAADYYRIQDGVDARVTLRVQRVQ